jgi:hypothetical protein
MRISRKLACAVVVMSSLSMPALAEEMKMGKGMSMIIMPDGTVATMQSLPKMEPKMGEEVNMMMMQGGKGEMKTPMIIMMGDDGKMYMVPDEKLSSGKMMSDTMTGK